jgi:P-type E1-E2 ATPase
VLERPKRTDTVVFDKTGTLTKGDMSLTDIHPANGVDPDELLSVTAAAEAGSEHPVGRAVVTAARQRGIPMSVAEYFEAVEGYGVRANVNGTGVWLGRRTLMIESNTRMPADLEAVADGLEAQGGRCSSRPGTAPSKGYWQWQTRSRRAQPKPSPNCTAWASRSG